MTAPAHAMNSLSTGAAARGAAVTVMSTVRGDGRAGDGGGESGDVCAADDTGAVGDAGDSMSVPITLARIAEVTGGRVDGDAGFTVAALKSLDSARADSLSFCAGGRHADALKTTAAGALLLRAEDAARFPRHKILVADPYLAYARASALFAPPAPPPGVHPTAVVAADAAVHPGATVGAYSVIGAGAVIARGAVIGAHVFIGDACVIGEHTVIDAGARIYAGVSIGRGCRIASGAVIGAPGFGYAAAGENIDTAAGENSGGDGCDGGGGDGETIDRTCTWTRIEQLGGVVIGDEVDIGAHTAIDRGALDDTVIGDRVKLDNHIQIAHNVRIGDDTIMAGCVAVAGSAVIGKRCQFGGRASVLGHLSIADDVRVHAGGFVAKSIAQVGDYSSLLPAMPAARWRRIVARLRRGGAG